VFTPNYAYEMLPTTDVLTVVTANAGNNTGANIADPVTASATITGPTSALTAGSALTLTAVPSGVAPTSYQWRLNNIAITGATSASYNVPAVQESQAGAYTVALGLPTGDLVVSRPLAVTVNPAPVAPPAAPAPAGGGGGAVSPWFIGLLLLATACRLYQQRRALPTEG
jgi:MprA protease rhombosortase-interaction domain-containing protein